MTVLLLRTALPVAFAGKNFVTEADNCLNGEWSVDDVNLDDTGARGTKARMAVARTAKREKRRYIMIALRLGLV